MNGEAIEPCFFAIRCQNRPEQVRNIHPSEPQTLASGKHSGKCQRSKETRKEPTLPVHAAVPCAASCGDELSRRCPSCCSPFSRCQIESAAPIKPTCVNA